MFKYALGVVLAMTAASFALYASLPDQSSAVPVLRWTTGPNPQVQRQVDLFHQWLVDHGHVGDDGQPAFRMAIDAANNQSTLIQAVSGVGGDVMYALVNQFQPMGLAVDLTEDARANGYTLDDGYAEFAGLLAADGRQYGYGASAFARVLWANLDTFEKYGMPPPPEQWTPEEFERMGLEFVRRANEGKARQDVFFIEPVALSGYHLWVVLARSQGVDIYNETLTASQLDDPVFVDLFERMRRWVREYRLCPSAAEEASQARDASLGNLADFMTGRVALIAAVRGSLVRMREAPPERRPRIAASQMPQYAFKNAPLAVRPIILYTGSRYPEQAKLFFRFLAGKEYNDMIIEQADGLPPNPAFAVDNPRFLNPPDYPNEGNVHANELKWAMHIGYAMPYSPYRAAEATNWLSESMQRFMADLDDARAATAYGKMRYDESIRDFVRNRDDLSAKYAADVELQKKIDARKAANEKIPAAWIKNRFYLGYYRAQGLLEE